MSFNRCIPLVSLQSIWRYRLWPSPQRVHAASPCPYFHSHRRNYSFDFFHNEFVLPLIEIHKNRIKQYIRFSSLSIIFWFFSMLLHVSVIYSFLLLSRMALYKYNRICLLSSLLMEPWAVCILGLLWIKPLWTYYQEYLVHMCFYLH